jgi:predicted MPP superfamily phosphohydrolase
MPREIGFLLFRILLPTLLLAIQFILYVKARNWAREKFPQRRWMQLLLAALFIVFNAALLYVVIVRPRPGEYSTWFLFLAAYPFFIWHGATLFIGIAVLISMLIKLPFQIIGGGLKLFKPVKTKIETLQAQPSYQRFDASRRTFIRRGMYSLTAVSFGASAYGMFVGKKEHEITEALFPIRNLPHQLHGFTIALVSDLHSSINMLKDEMEEYVKIVNSLQCDLILVTGDFVNSLTEEVYPFAEAFSNLSAPHGVYGVMGNHDFFAPQPELVAKEVDACGVKLLRNDKVLIKKNSGSFYLVGVDDVGTAKRAEEKIDVALGSAPLNIPKLLMMHRPYFLQQASDKNIDLVLSGHTHGGQVVLANFGKVVIAPASLASRYVWGKYKIGSTQMYVNRGLGTVGLPIRLNCPPEITKITLMPQPSHV